jgi:hypothetical protein
VINEYEQSGTIYFYILQEGSFMFILESRILGFNTPLGEILMIQLKNSKQLIKEEGFAI